MIRWFAAITLLFFALAAMAQAPKPGIPDEKEKSKLKRPDDDGKKTTDPAQAGESEEAKIIDRLNKNSKSAEKRLGDRDPGEQTRKIQRDVLKDIDDLIDLLKQQPPQSDQSQSSSSSSSSSDSSSSKSGSSSSSSGGSSKSKSPPSSSGASGGKSGGKSGLSRREQREQRRQQEQQANSGDSPKGNAKSGSSQGNERGKNNPMTGQQPGAGNTNPMNDPKLAGNQSKPGDPKQGPNAGMPGKPKGDPNAADMPLADIYKDIWGHLPEKMRQEMDAYFKERFMPRYSDLLRQYYSTIAEQGKK